MLGRRNIRDSMGYVTLGLFTNALLDELLEIRRHIDDAPERTKIIKLAIKSLEAVDSPQSVDPKLLPDLVFQDYQEVSTLRKILSSSSMSSSDLVRNLIDICDTIDSNKRGKDVLAAIGFFSELSHKSIVNAERTEERIPPGVKLIGSK